MIEPVDERVYSRRLADGFSLRSRRGFSFVEILFAVMILGIGFILIAGVFPVAINQTQSNGDETIAASTARTGAAIIASLPNTYSNMAYDAIVHPFGATSIAPGPDTILWNELNGAQVLAEDPRYAWVPFYCRGKDAFGLPANTAQITIIAVRVRNHATYTLADQSSASGTLVGTRIPGVSLTANASLLTPDQITFPSNPATAAVAPGSFVIVSQDYNTANTPNATGSAVGWVLKVGAPVPPTAGSPIPSPPVTYFLQPGGDMKNQTIYRPPPGDIVDVYIVGQGIDPDNPGTAANPNYSGGAQDIMAYTTFIPLH